MSSQDELTGRITTLVEGVRGVFDSDRSLPRAWRVRQLKGILKLVNTHEEELVAALKEDLGVNDFWCVCNIDATVVWWQRCVGLVSRPTCARCVACVVVQGARCRGRHDP